MEIKSVFKKQNVPKFVISTAQNQKYCVNIKNVNTVEKKNP